MLLDIAGHRRSPATMSRHQGHRPPRDKGEHHPAEPTDGEEIVAVMYTVADRADRRRLRALTALLWRAGVQVGMGSAGAMA
jgi:hypothetical protein